VSNNANRKFRPGPDGRAGPPEKLAIKKSRKM
jgi:hypothetical protein